MVFAERGNTLRARHCGNSLEPFRSPHLHLLGTPPPHERHLDMNDVDCRCCSIWKHSSVLHVEPTAVMSSQIEKASCRDRWLPLELGTALNISEAAGRALRLLDHHQALQSTSTCNHVRSSFRRRRSHIRHSGYHRKMDLRLLQRPQRSSTIPQLCTLCWYHQHPIHALVTCRLSLTGTI